ncbi:staygreen family protein [Anaerocolumna sp. MB42-C2]|uniref:staygreen family protein n=1 Tax=Anaerocolumna sp. MB42-C2 TaxID=3070997 RepID=UPI0027DF45D1|nr:staygreen family protein [Anaerocolumna sp. MB42-C2]WMJ86290.1 staygreen family protein [Anaerocolumna sp. MB42-C2]
MSRLDPKKLTVEFLEGVTETSPVIPRRYTLTHSDLTGELFLNIGPDFNYDKVNNNRDDVLGEWLWVEEEIRYYVYLHVDGQFGQENAEIRDKIFRRELPLALEAIRFGDKSFFEQGMNQSPIIVYFLYSNPYYNKAENWGTFADYDITSSGDRLKSYSRMEYKVLIDEKIGDVTGDGIPDKICLYGDKSPNSDYISNITIEIRYGKSEMGTEIITEVSGYKPALFLGDFTKDNVNDFIFSIINEDGGYEAFIYSYKEEEFDLIFETYRYNTEYLFWVEYNDLYKVSAANVMLNKIFYLDISYKGYDYLSRYYNEKGELIKPIAGKAGALTALIPFIAGEQEKYFDLLALQPIIGEMDDDILGYIENRMSWNGERFETVNILTLTPGADFIPKQALESEKRYGI